MEAAIDAGADDVESDEDGHRIYTSFESISCRGGSRTPVRRAEVDQVHLQAAEQCSGRCRKGETLLSSSVDPEDDDDVQNVYIFEL